MIPLMFRCTCFRVILETLTRSRECCTLLVDVPLDHLWTSPRCVPWFVLDRDDRLRQAEINFKASAWVFLLTGDEGDCNSEVTV